MSSSVPIIWALSCTLMLPNVLQATPLTDKVRLDAAQANNFLTHSRPRREGDPKWYQKDPNFQSYYRYYSSIGHTEGLYEIDKLRMLFHQMRHLEHTYGSDASKYQNALGLRLPKVTPPAPKTKPPPPPTAPPPPALPPFSKADVIYLCNAKDPLCKPQIVYLPTGAVPILCDPRYHPSCKLEPVKNPPPAEPDTPAPPPAKKPKPSPPPAPVIVKGMEYDCDPYWDPDCLIDHPPRPVKVSPPLVPPTKSPVVEKIEQDEEEEDSAAPPVDKTISRSPYHYYDPYDYRRDLYNPYLYPYPHPNPQ